MGFFQIPPGGMILLNMTISRKASAPLRSSRDTRADRAVADVAVGHRLERIRGQLAGVRRMLEEGRECADVVVQLLAIRAAVEKAASAVVLSHVDECLDTLPRDQAKRAVAEAIQQFGRLS